MQVKQGSVTENAGIARGDIITQINTTSIENSKMYLKAVSTLKKGDIVRFLIKRGESTLFVAMKVD
jgi:serine protease Do